MLIYVCMHCRKELYKENEEEINCEDHPNGPADYVYAQNEEYQYEEEQ